MKFYMWSLGHFAFILSPFILTYLLHLLTKTYDQKKKRTVGIYLSAFSVALLMARNIDIFIYDGYIFSFELIPLQVCHFANLVLLYSFWKRSEVGFGLAFCLNLLAAFLSIIFADGLAVYISILTVRGVAYIVGHVTIVVITAWAFFNDFIYITKHTIKKVIIVVEVMILISILANNVMYTISGVYGNYFYTVVPALGTPLEWGYNLGKVYTYGSFTINYFYVFCLMILFPIIAYFFYHIAKLFRKAE